MDLLLLALLVALAVWSARKGRIWWRARAVANERARTPGYSPDNPIVLKSARQLEEAIASASCQCGGKIVSLGETPRLGLRVARGRCVECERDVDLYFVMPRFVN